jgi:ribosome-associated protein
MNLKPIISLRLFGSPCNASAADSLLWRQQVRSPTLECQETAMDFDEITQQILRRAQWSASRSSWPGGQHRDKASTRADLVLTAERLKGLDPEIVERLVRRLGLDLDSLRISIQDDRSLARNQEIAAERLRERVVDALLPEPPPRRPTRPGRGARRARLEAKVRRGSTKRLRRSPDSESE